MRSRLTRVLSLHPTSRGFGYIVMEGPKRPVDWSIKSTRGNKASETITKVKKLIEQYRPHVVVLEDCDAKGCRRCKRVRRLASRIRATVTARRRRCRQLPDTVVKRVFLGFGARTKHEIALTIVDQVPELADRLPRIRKPWMSEQYQKPLFDAAALALTFYYTQGTRKTAKK